jgi:hypothetical protein
MNLIDITPEHHWYKYPSFYNVYPIFNEIHPSASGGENKTEGTTSHFIDTYYGRIYDYMMGCSSGIYGKSSSMKNYVSLNNLTVVDELRVPFRKIPVYEVSSKDQIESAVNKIRNDNSGYEILLRGQTKLYLLDRPEQELEFLYGSTDVKEPSFLPSHLRHNYDEVFLQSMWHNQAAMMFNDIGYDYSKTLSKDKFELYQKDINYIRNTHLMTAFSLGIAQHYGMPSVGLDLSDDLEVASWFASNSMRISKEGTTATLKVDSSTHETSMIYIFRCPKDAVFDYKSVKPKIFPAGRPDAQSAWFGHVGWGAASNQLGSYLACAFKLSKEFLDSLPHDIETTLFPKKIDDPILDFFVKMRGQDKYEGDAKKALQNVYYLD